ncbi:MAG: Ig-like domain-containing protein [Oscillospiraceae bacterium]|nr:Ig-like domain-containing protein [Oscillospiraceae bacterium]
MQKPSGLLRAGLCLAAAAVLSVGAGGLCPVYAAPEFMPPTLTIAPAAAGAALPVLAPPLTGLTLSSESLALGPGDSATVTVTAVTPARWADGVVEAPTYTSSDETVCTVDGNGLVTAAAPGTATVTVTLHGASAVCTVTVEQPATVLTGGIRLLPFNYEDILAIGNQAPGQCSLYAMRYARTITDGSICSGAGMWGSVGAIWSAGGFSAWNGGLTDCLDKLYSELNAGHPVIVHLQNTHVEGVSKHSDRTTTHEYHADGAGGWTQVNWPHISTSAVYGHWVCVVGYAADADPAALKESDFFALDPARVNAGGTLALTRLLDGTVWTANSPLKVLG